MIALDFLKGKNVAVLGLGKSGLTAAEALHKSGATVLAWDDRENGRLEAEKLGLPVVDLSKTDFETDVDMLVMSPGIPHTHPKPHPVAELAKNANVELICDVELLYRAQPEATFVGITGTNGKSTTTALLDHILTDANVLHQMGGNIGNAALSLEPLGKGGIYVLELSSYQIELCPTLACDVACLLNVTPDHLERHGGMAGYIKAKKTLFDQQKAGSTAFISIDDGICKNVEAKISIEGEAKVVPVSILCTPMNGVSAPDGKISARFTDGAQKQHHFGDFINLIEIARLPGRHNWQNGCMVAGMALTLGLEPEQILKGMKSFAGLAHRQQLIGMLENVRFVNDFEATNAEATAKALGCYEPIYWIVGGQAKETGLDGLDDYMPRIQHAFLIGEAQDDFAEWLDGKTPLTKCTTLDIAVKQAADMALADGKTDATVLLSPACASWDQYASFEARGTAFEKLVDKYQHQKNNA